ncbi:helix-turn-helix transcriptional regulator [Dysosmobacter welbionis]|uniref:helix-turn-helix transcriptional regulator n=1 Tax=Dysosmobacter welbionis TaxID=2093857 RepID=UPI0033905EBC
MSHIFRQKTGYSLKQYVLRRRIGEAQMRLVNAQDSVQTISEAVGFADASYFSRIFSKYVGLTPTEYRKFRIGP